MDSDDFGCASAVIGLLLLVGIMWFLIGTGAKKVYDVAVGGTPDNPQTIVFGGRVSQSNHQRWQNNRLVIVYAQDAEIGRNITHTAVFRQFVERPTDGVFSISVENIYGLSVSDIPNCKPMVFAFKTGYCWLGEFQDDSDARELKVDYKRLQYSVRVLPGAYDALPEEMKEAGITGLVDGNIVVVSSKVSPQGLLDKFLGRTPSTKPDATPNLIQSVRLDPKLEIVDVPSQEQTVNIDNCNGSLPSETTITDSKTFVREVQVHLTAGAKIPLEEVELQLGAQGGYHQKQISTKTVKQQVAAAPKTNVSYEVHWTEIWQRGTVVVQGKKAAGFPFRLRKDIRYSIKAIPHLCMK